MKETSAFFGWVTSEEEMILDGIPAKSATQHSGRDGRGVYDWATPEAQFSPV